MNGCSVAPFSGGLCERHYREDEERSAKRRAAIDALHTGCIDGQMLENPELRDEFQRLRVWWQRACDVSISQRGMKEMPLDEAEAAGEWCIALAAEIVCAELAKRSGHRLSGRLEATRPWVWERFENLEKGLMSNGLPRHAP